MRFHHDQQGRLVVDHGLGAHLAVGQPLPTYNVASPPSQPTATNVPPPSPPSTQINPPSACPPPGYPTHTLDTGSSCCIPAGCAPAAPGMVYKKGGGGKKKGEIDTGCKSDKDCGKGNICAGGLCLADLSVALPSE